MPLPPSRPGGLLDFPSKIQIQTHNRCNYLCPMCPYPEMAPEGGGVRLDGELYYRLVNEVREAGRRVKLCLMLQNEPLLDKRFLEFLDHAHGAEDAIVSVSTVSNGSVLSEELLDALMRYPRFHLTISVNSTDRERYQRIHGRDLWDRVHGLLARWNGQRNRVRVSFVLDALSVDDGRRFQDYWRGLGYGTRLIPFNARVDLKDPANLHEPDMEYGHCHYPVDTLNVLADGGVILCCNDWRHEERYGNLRQHSISEVWNSPGLVRLRQAAVRGTLREHPMCKGCDYPIRSSQRLRLEAMLADEAPPLVNEQRPPFVTHRGALRVGPEGRLVHVLVWAVEEAAGVVTALVPRSEVPVSGEGWFELRIGHSGAFNFGGLEPIWCPARFSRVEAEGLPGDTVPLRIELDARVAEFQFFPWYCADWALVS